MHVTFVYTEVLKIVKYSKTGGVLWCSWNDIYVYLMLMLTMIYSEVCFIIIRDKIGYPLAHWKHPLVNFREMWITVIYEETQMSVNLNS